MIKPNEHQRKNFERRLSAVKDKLEQNLLEDFKNAVSTDLGQLLNEVTFLARGEPGNNLPKYYTKKAELHQVMQGVYSGRLTYWDLLSLVEDSNFNFVEKDYEASVN